MRPRLATGGARDGRVSGRVGGQVGGRTEILIDGWVGRKRSLRSVIGRSGVRVGGGRGVGHGRAGGGLMGGTGSHTTGTQLQPG